MNTYETFIYKRTYARWLEESLRRESWKETVYRYGGFFSKRVPGDMIGRFTDAMDLLSAGEVVPSMRAFFTAGPALERENIAGYNCAASVIGRSSGWYEHKAKGRQECTTVKSFADLLYIALCGTGTGFSVERQFIADLPEIPSAWEDVDADVIFEDSKRGWAQGFLDVAEAWFRGEDPEWDLSKIRKKGERLKTFGGRASGPEPLNLMLIRIKRIVKGARGRKLNSLECHDICCHINNAVVVGGVRRASGISMSNLSDDRMRNAKTGMFWNANPQRFLANNSVVYTEKPTMSAFMKEWTALMESGTGERGIINREACNEKVWSLGTRAAGFPWVVNPCVPATTPILTDKGHVPIGTVVGEKVNVWNGHEYSEVEPFYSGIKDIVNVKLSDGTDFICSTNHQFVLKDDSKVKAEDIRVGAKLKKFEFPVVTSGWEYNIDAYSQGFYSGDGTAGLNHSWLYFTKYSCKDRLIGTYKGDFLGDKVTWKHGEMYQKDFVPVDGNLEYCLNWLAGALDADGTVTRDLIGNGLQLSSIDKPYLMKVKLMLARLGAYVKVVDGHPEGGRIMPDGRGGEKSYHCQAVYRLLIGNLDTYNLMKLGLSFSRLDVKTVKPQRCAKRFTTVLSVEPMGQEEVYCFTDPKRGQGTFYGVVTKNCGEIILRPNGFCNLSEAIVRATDSLDALKRKVRAAAAFGCLQSTLTDFNFVDPEFKKNCDEERLIGVSLSGLRDHPTLGTTSVQAAVWLTDLRNEVHKEAAIWAKALGINTPAAMTTVKPSGTVSQMVGCASGIHPRFSQYYIRRVRVTATDALCGFLRDKGVPHSPETGENTDGATTFVFDFPVKSPDGCTTNDDVDAIEQLEYWKMIRDNYTDHNPSATIYVSDSEWLAVGAWVYENWDSISGLSFLPKDESVYELSPYEAITKEEFDRMIADFPEIDFTELDAYERGDTTMGAQELACSGGSCELR